MRKVFFLSLTLALLSGFNSYGQSERKSFPGRCDECMSAIKTGVFTYEGLEDEVKIIRTDTSQTEIYNNGESKLLLDIEWVSNDEYVLTHKKAIHTNAGCLEPGDRITTKIIGCSGDKFYSVYVSNRCGKGTNTFVKLDN